jgi:ureidoglycolate dehydrogenase (NAD+)
MTSLMAGRAILEPWIRGENQRHHQSALLVAIDISQFGNLDDYCNQVESLAKIIKTLPKAEDVDEILMPGERSDAFYEERTRNGYRVPLKVWEKVADVADKYNVQLPKLDK